MAKRSTKTAHIKKLYLSIITSIKEHGKLPETSMKKTTFQYYINKLKSVGVISKKGYGVWSVDLDKFESLEFQKEVRKQHSGTKNIRGHGFQWKLNIPNITNWYKREDILNKLNIFYQKGVNNKGQKVCIKDYKLWLFDKCIIVYTPKDKSFYDYSAKNSYQDALIDVLNVIKSLESKLKIDLRLDFKYKITCSKQHYAHLRNELAKEYNDSNKKLYVKFDGQGWLLIDKSLGTDELETIHSKTARFDSDRVVEPFFNDLREHGQQTGECLKMSDLLKIVQAQQNQINSLLYRSPDPLDKKDSYFG